MAGKPQYTEAEILWFVKQVFEFDNRNEYQVCAAFEERFGRELKPHQYKYLKGKYGKDASYKPEISKEAQLPILPIQQDYATMSSQTMGGYGNIGQGLNPSQAMEGYGNIVQGLNPSQTMEGYGNIVQGLNPSQTMEGYGNIGQGLNSSQAMEGYGNVGQGLNSSQAMEGYGNVGQGLNSSQAMEGYGNVGQGLNGGSSGIAEANHYTTARHPTANNTPRQTTEAPVPVPRQAGPSGSSTMYTASRTPRAARRHQAARAAAYQQAQAAVHADEQIERQLQNGQQVHEMQQMFQWQQMQGMSQPQYPANQTPMFWPQPNVSPSMQQAHFSHDMHQAPGYAHQEIFAGGQPNWMMNPYPGHQPPVADYPQQVTYVGNHGQELSTQPWIETQGNHLQGRQSPAPVAYMGIHDQELEIGPQIGTQEPHLQGMEYPTPVAPEIVFNAPEQVSLEVAPQLGALDLATARETEENQQEIGQGMQKPSERNGEPYPSPELSNGQSRQSTPLSHGESQQSEPLSHGESQQSMPLSEEGQAASRNLQEPTPVNHVSPPKYEVIKILHLQNLLHGGASNSGTSNGTENAEEQDGEVADFNIEDFLNLENAP